MVDFTELDLHMKDLSSGMQNTTPNNDRNKYFCWLRKLFQHATKSHKALLIFPLKRRRKYLLVANGVKVKEVKVYEIYGIRCGHDTLKPFE